MKELHELFQLRLEKQSEDYDPAVVKAVRYVFELGAVPYPDRDERRHLRDEHREQLAYAIAENLSQALAGLSEKLRKRYRIEYIVSAPEAQRHVPSAPEFRNAVRKIRPHEIVRHLYAHHACDSPGDIDPARKIRIYLHAVSEQRYEHYRSVIISVVVEYLAHQHCYPVSDHEFLEKPPQYQLHSVREIRIREAVPFVKLPGELVIARDRPLYDLREKRKEQRKSRQTAVRLDLAPVQIYYVCRRLERVERDPQRDQYSQIELHATVRLCQYLYVVSEIFQRREYAKISQQYEKDHFSLPFFHCGF